SICPPTCQNFNWYQSRHPVLYLGELQGRYFLALWTRKKDMRKKLMYSRGGIVLSSDIEGEQQNIASLHHDLICVRIHPSQYVIVYLFLCGSFMRVYFSLMMCSVNDWVNPIPLLHVSGVFGEVYFFTLCVEDVFEVALTNLYFLSKILMKSFNIVSEHFEEGGFVEKNNNADENIIIMDNLNFGESLAKKTHVSIAKRLRSNSGKVVATTSQQANTPSKGKKPETAKKSVNFGPPRSASKVHVSTAKGKKSLKRKEPLSSDSEFEEEIVKATTGGSSRKTLKGQKMPLKYMML
ncbi:hypothetical protein L195_g011398, partial [Trifolium pratense]